MMPNQRMDRGECHTRMEELMALCDQLQAARAGERAVRDRLTTATLSRLTAPDQPPEAAPQNARFALQALLTLTTHTAQIKTLRQTILNLAVRGKLVAQDAGDEPAAELLKRIAKEKSCQKPKLFNPIEVEPFPLPDSWVWVRLGEIGETQTGSTPPKSNPEYYGFDVPFLRPGDLYPTHVDYTGVGLSFVGADASGRLAPSGSILMVCIGTIGKVQLIDRSSSFNQQINALTPFPPHNSTFLLRAIQSDFFQTAAWGASAKTTIAILNKGNWEQLPVPLPPLAEQHRIVARVDALMALCDQLEASLTTTLTTRSRLLEALLHEALGGQPGVAA
jgi:type I restriction enzyme S subunit